MLGVHRWRVTEMIGRGWVIVEMPKSTPADVKWKVREHGPAGIGVGFGTLRWWECLFVRRQWRKE